MSLRYSIPLVLLTVLVAQTGCRTERNAALGPLPDEVKNAQLLVVQGPLPPDSTDRETHPECPVRLRDARTGWDFLLSQENVRPSKSKAPASWPHDGDYRIILPQSGEGPGTARVRINCVTLEPMGMLNVNARVHR